MPPPPPSLRGWAKSQGNRFTVLAENTGQVAILIKRAFVALFTTRFEFKSLIYQMEQLGVKSLGIGAATLFCQRKQVGDVIPASK